MKKIDIKDMALIGVMVALMCVLGPLSIPIGAVPVSLTMFTTWLAAYILGGKKSGVAVLIYLLIGAVGLPVFSGATGGLAKLVGATGGYLIGFLPMAIISGFFVNKFYKNYAMQVIGMLLGMVVCYTFGTIWFMILMNMGLMESLAICVFPFILFDFAKLAFAIIVGRTVRTALSSVLQEGGAAA